MGWDNGSYLAENIWQMVKEYLPENKRFEVAKKIYKIFCDQDADDWCDQDIYKTLFPFECMICGERISKEQFDLHQTCDYCYKACLKNT